MADSQVGADSTNSISDHTLIGLLQASVDRLKTTVDTQQMTTELKIRDERRTAIMIKLAQENVERSKESQARLQRDLELAKRECADLNTERNILSQKVRDLEESSATQNDKLQKITADFASQLKTERDEREAVNRTVVKLRSELAEAKQAAVAAAAQGELQYRELYQENATSKARIATQSEELEFITEQRAKESRLVAEREYELNRTIGALKKNVARLESDLDTQRRSAFETVTVLQSENEQLRTRVIQLESMVQEADRDATTKTHQLKQDFRRLQERVEIDYATWSAKEKSLQQESSTLAVHLRAAQQEINEMAEREAANRRTGITDVVKLHAERDALQAKVISLERQLQEAQAAARVETIRLKTDVETGKNENILAEQRFAAEIALKRDENAKLKDELSLAAQQFAEAAAGAVKQESELRSQVDWQDKEIKRLGVEVAGYKETVEKLDKHVRENYAVRLLEDELSTVKQQTVQLKNQLTQANSALANLRVEADITENSRMRAMHEQVVEAQRRSSSLERELRFARPLLGDLVDALRHTSALDAGLERDVEMFFRQFGAGGSLV
jgi:hypothetical protein